MVGGEGLGRNEAEVIERLVQRLGRPHEGEVWIGDDAAWVRGTGGFILLAADCCVAGIHADLSLVSLEDLGWRAAAVNLSDIAAMGGRPLHLLCCLAAPFDTDVDAILEGVAEAASAHSASLVGGDLSNSDQVVVAVSITGACDATPPVLRSGARPGDAVMLTGDVGGAAAGLALLRHQRPPTDPSLLGRLVAAYRRPWPRVAEGRAAARAGATAMIDVSDGFASDLAKLAFASGVGVVLEAIPVAEGASLEDALFGGDDYELVFCAPDPERVQREFQEAGLREPLVVGHATEGPPRISWNGEEIEQRGWQHHFK